MLIFELGLALLTGGALLALLADRIGAPYPSLLALAGVGLAFVPGMPELQFDPQLALALFVAPALMEAGFNASIRDLRHNWSPISGLVVAAVFTTVALVAWVAHELVPGLPWAAAIALGAIVAPTDASAAIPVLRQLAPPHRIMTILEGESLFNDAVALLIFNGAVGVVGTGAFRLWPELPLLALSVAGGIVAGYGLARLYLWLSGHLRDIPVEITMQFVSTFLVWILAERLGLSAIITVVVFALTIGHIAPLRAAAWHRVRSNAVWEVAVLVLNILAFVLIGLQLRSALRDLSGVDGAHWIVVIVAVLTAVLLGRVAWVMGYITFVRRRNSRTRADKDPLLPSWHAGVIISWCGLRGVVTLAAALALPGDFPSRGLLVVVAFAVVLGTLLLQGLTLRPLLGRLTLHDDRLVEREVEMARSETARAAVAALHRAPDTQARTALLLEYQREGEPPPDGIAALQQGAVQAQRHALARLRQQGRIGDAAFQEVQAGIDRLDIGSEDALVHDTE